ncbi:MAG: UvrD-helicase domain-containing protein [Ktedonobacteraceae bacterium]
MDDQIRAAASAAARQLLLRYKEEHPQWQDDKTPLADLAAWLDIQVETFHPNDYPIGTYGFLEPGEDLIWLCRDLPATLQRFTLAHELGHAVLHRDVDSTKKWYLMRAATTGGSLLEQHIEPELAPVGPCQQPDVQEEMPGLHEPDTLEDVLGIGMTYDPRSERELAANIFAAELLMPLERVQSLYLDQHISPRALANIFDVSNAAMLNRLVGLLAQPEAGSGQPQELSLHTLQVTTPPITAQDNKEQAKPAPKQYDEFQRAAIEAVTPALIVAGPGSGKTSTLIGRVEYLITSQQVEPAHILALTFSRKAAQEMDERLELVLQGNGPLMAKNKPMVSTFHAFCANVLRNYADLVGLRPDFTLIDETEGYFLLRQLTNDMQLYHYRNLVSPASYFPDFLKAISRAKDELATPEDYQQLAEAMLEQAHDEEAELSARKALEVASIYALYEEGLRQRGDVDFGGLIMLTVRLFEQHPEVCNEQQQRFQHILVDEFQDINRASGILLRLLAGKEQRVWVVGDANQAIYGFRGASPANIANFQQDYPGAQVLPLSRNYRSRPDIVHLAEAFRWKQLELGTETEVVANQPARLTHPDTYVTLAEAEDNANELAGLIADIRYKHAQGYAYSDIAILCRTRARANKIMRALADAELPIIEQRGLLNQPHIKDLISILLLLTDASGMGILRAARHKEHALAQSDIETMLLAARAQSRSPGMLISSAEIPPQVSMEGRHTLIRLADILQSLFQSATSTWSLLAQYLFIETSIARELLHARKQGQHSDVLADYMAFLQLARRYDLQQQAQYARQVQQAEERGEKAAPAPGIQEQAQDLLDYLHVMLSLGQDGGSRQQGADGNGEESADVIHIMTVHASKGLEFPVVYLPGLIQRNFPLQRQANPVPIPVGMLAPASADINVHEVGEACLFYVGVTRARDQLVLSYSKRNGKQTAKLSSYVQALLAGLPAERITRLQWQGLVKAPTGNEEEDSGILPASQPSQDFIDAVKAAKLHASALETYQRCPRQYLYSYIYGFRSKEGGYHLFWQATQKTLEVLQQKHAPASDTGAEQETRLPSLEEAQQFYREQWQALGGESIPFASIYEQHGHEVTSLLHSTLLESGTTRWELRPTLTVEVAGKTIQVAVDRVEAPLQTDKPVKFVRTRFGKSKDKPTAGMRELLYANAYRQHHAGQNIELHLHNLSTGETVPITLSAKKEQSLYNELEQCIQGLERNEYPAYPDARTCPDCAFFLICPA